ncbi:MAG: hypothetical protein EBZ48_04535 [Proteobacteria bacterium]|nr:hypothetical protein [Pseudomonadota bacterium]
MEQQQCVSVARTSSNRLVRGVQIVGVGSTAFGALVLMLEGLGRVDAISRFFSLSGIIALSAVIGLVIAARRTDNRSARILLTMFLGLVPVFWSQLGAVVYSALEGSVAAVPVAMRIAGASLVTAGCCAVLAAAVIAPLSALVARVLIPSAPGLYTTLFLFMGVTVCLPIREGLMAECLLVLSSSLLVLAERRCFGHSLHFNTAEARWARAALLSIPVITVGRAMYYDVSGAVVFAVLALLGAALFILVPPRDEAARTSKSCASDLLLALGCSALAGSMSAELGWTTAHQLSYLVPAAFLMVVTPDLRAVQSKIAAMVLALGSAMFRDDPNIVAGVAAVLLPLGVVVYGAYVRSTWLTVLGVCSACIGSATLLVDILSGLYEYRWSGLMIAGIVLVAAAPYCEVLLQKIGAKSATLTPSNSDGAECVQIARGQR